MYTSKVYNTVWEHSSNYCQMLPHDLVFLVTYSKKRTRCSGILNTAAPLVAAATNDRTKREPKCQKGICRRSVGSSGVSRSRSQGDVRRDLCGAPCHRSRTRPTGGRRARPYNGPGNKAAETLCADADTSPDRSASSGESACVARGVRTRTRYGAGAL